MPKESKVLRMFELLTDKYEVKVGKNQVQDKDEQSLVLNVTELGMRFSFNSKNDNYRKFLMSIATKELGETLSSMDIRELNHQLESIAHIIQTSDVCEKGRGCGCKVDEPLDEE